jgi:hypothetical protein
VRDHITLVAYESLALIGCLLRAAEVGSDTDNLDLVAMAEDLADLILDKWFPEGNADV